MPQPNLPEPIERYFATKASSSAEDTLALFSPDATVWDNGEDLELRGIDAIRGWMRAPSLATN